MSEVSLKGESLYMNLALTPAQCRRYYSGQVRMVLARCDDGRRVQFPVAMLRPYIDRQGVHGHFCLRHDARGKCLSFERLS